jgi:hypothetical protein
VIDRISLSGREVKKRHVYHTCDTIPAKSQPRVFMEWNGLGKRADEFMPTNVNGSAHALARF